MKTDLQISHQGIEVPVGLDGVIREQVEKLERHCPEIIGCRVTITEPHKSHKSGGHYAVTVDVSIPGEEIVANHDHGQRDFLEDPYAAVRDAFRAAIREVDSFKERRRDQARRGQRPV